MPEKHLSTHPQRLLRRLWSVPSRLGAQWIAAARPAQETFAPPASLGRIGSLEVRLARSVDEVQQAQSLRYRVFFEEGCAAADPRTRAARRDVDDFDAICDHLLVLDHGADASAPHPEVVGTYRLLPQAVAMRHSGFYSSSEFDLAPLLARHRELRFLELGRSCVLPAYRNKRTVELLWHGCWSYVRRSEHDVMIGCASLEGTDPGALAMPLSYLHHFARAPESWRAAALPGLTVDMNLIAQDAIDPRAALRALPPLIKGYLRLGAFVGDGAVVDRQFGTTDVLIILPVSAINARYIGHFGADAERHAA